jgi:hypothetical protein
MGAVMAVASVIPPPPNAPPLVEQIRELAERMAKSVGCGVGDVLRRTKSRNWMLGQIRKLRPNGLDDDEVRDCIVELAKTNRPTPVGEQVVKLTNRRPIGGLEPSDWPCWSGRAESLGAQIVYPMDIAEVIRRSQRALGWSKNFTIQSTAAAEDVGELWWDGIYWQRTKERIIVQNTKAKVKRVVRHLPVELRDVDKAELINRLNAIDDERKALEAELFEQKSTLTAKLKDRATARERVIDSLRTGRETQLVTCEERYDYSSRTVTTVRKDTGAVVETREMNASELQLALPETQAS